MKKLIILLIPFLLLAGCTKSEVEPVIEPESVDVELSMTIEEARQMTEQYITGMKEYVDNYGYHPEEIESYTGACSGCYVFIYEFRTRTDGVDGPIGVANVQINITDGKISKVLYEEAESEPVELEIQPDPIIGGQRDEHGCLGPAGYQWCEITQKCQRFWEEPCE